MPGCRPFTNPIDADKTLEWGSKKLRYRGAGRKWRRRCGAIPDNRTDGELAPGQLTGKPLRLVTHERLVERDDDRRGQRRIDEALLESLGTAREVEQLLR